jgi:hypothetical protein
VRVEYATSCEREALRATVVATERLTLEEARKTVPAASVG